MPVNFSLEYFISIAISLTVAYTLPDGVNPMIRFFVVPISIAYISLMVMNYATPQLNRVGHQVTTYVENRTLGEINSTNYFQIFPPILFVLIFFMIILYRNDIL